MLKKFLQTALLLVVFFTTTHTYAQVSQAPDGIQFQALATDASGRPAADRVIYVKDAIIAKTATGTIVYSETFKVTASSAGIFTIVLGKGTYASGVSSITNIDWSNGPFFLNLKVAVEPTFPNASWNVNNEYVDLGTSQFWSVPYAMYADNVKGADTKLNIADTAAMLKPYFNAINLKANIESPTFTGTVKGITKAMVGLSNVDNTSDVDKPVSTATQAALNLKANTTDVNTALALKVNTADVINSLATKVDKVTGKELSTNDYTTAEKTKLAAITGTNTGDQDLSALATNTALALKANTTDVNTALNLKANTTDVNTALALKVNTADVTNSLATKVDKVTGKGLSTNDYTTAEKTKLAAITGTNTGDQDLSALATNTALALKANTTDVNTALNLKANTTDVNTALALKVNTADVTNSLATKVDKVTGKGLSTNDYTTAEKTKLAAITGTNTGDQDLSALATNTALALKANTTDVNTALNLKANTTDVNTALALKVNTADVTNSLATKVDKVTGKELSTNDYTTAEKTKLAAITGTNTGDQDLSALATNTALALKANTADVNTALNLKANTSDVNTNLATKVDKVTGKGLSTNDYTTVEKTKLAAITGTNTGDQDLSALATNTALALKANTADVNTALNLKANTSDVNTNLATKVDKVTGKELSTNDYTTAEKTKLAAITGTNTGDQVNITGNAATATLAVNISATTNTTLTSLANLATVGTITSGTISLTTDIATTGNLKAGNNTYPNVLGSDGQFLKTNGSGTLSWASVPSADLTNYLTTNTAQTITASKTFSDTTTFSKDALINGLIVGRGGGNKSNNTVSGAYALISNTTGGGNTATGFEALALNEKGSSNTAFGFGALSSNVAGSDNTAIGNGANVGSDSLTNATAIGSGAIVNTGNTIQLGNTAVTNVKTSGAITAGGKIIAGASSASSTSAVMEANSTTQGFLPPRLTTTQRDSIASPVAGLTIWNTTNTQLEVYDGSFWKNMVGLLVSPLKVGDSYGGGIVFYIFGPSDNGYIKGQTHGLIAALEDQTTDAGVKWFPDKFYGATGTYIGLGLPNTLGIIAAAVVTGTTNLSSFAAGLANSYRGGGNIDWYLPSIDELKKMYENKDAIGGFATSGIPGYWSSTQRGGISFTNFTSFANGVTHARLQFFFTGGDPSQSTGTLTNTEINNLRRVRAIRMF